jgi:hypothetical protein
MVELRALAINGPDAENDKVVRWRCIDLRDEVARRFTVTVTERAIGNWLRTLKLTRSQPRPLHPKKDAAAREAFKESAPITNFVGGKPGRRMIQTQMHADGPSYLCVSVVEILTGAHSAGYISQFAVRTR